MPCDSSEVCGVRGLSAPTQRLIRLRDELRQFEAEVVQRLPQTSESERLLAVAVSLLKRRLCERIGEAACCEGGPTPQPSPSSPSPSVAADAEPLPFRGILPRRRVPPTEPLPLLDPNREVA